jgi:nanoRNase/pAp phosphatase (c-di-AMP/oligoRNAs hydrolase)
MARNPMEETTKVSLRVVGIDQNHDLRQVIDSIIKPIHGAESGGHKEAAGAIIPISQEQQLFEEAKRVLKNYSIEENIE